MIWLLSSEEVLKFEVSSRNGLCRLPPSDQTNAAPSPINLKPVRFLQVLIQSSTSVTSATANAAQRTITLALTNKDTGGSGLREIRVFMSTDQDPTQEWFDSPIILTSANPTGIFNRTLTYSGI